MSVLGRSSLLQDVWFSDEGDPDEGEIHSQVEIIF